MKFLMRQGILLAAAVLCVILGSLIKIPTLTVWQLCSIVVPTFLAGVFVGCSVD